MSTSLQGFLSRFQDVVAAAYSDFAFLAPRGELNIVEHVPRVSRLRVQLPGKQFLHLHSVEIDAVGVPDLAGAATLSASSHWRGESSKLERGLLFEAEGTHTSAFHTQDDHRPWLDIEFKEPVDITRMLLRNVDSGTSVRAKDIHVVATSESGEHSVLYDGRARAEELRRSIAAMSRHANVVADPPGSALGPVLCDLVAGSYAEAVKQLKEMRGLTPEDAEQVRTFASTGVLHDRSLEWTIHGIKRSFRFWSERERRDYVGFMVQTAAELRELTDKVCLGFGGVLGVVREGGLISHDDDLDLIIGFEPDEAATLADGIQRVREFLTARGYRVSGDHLAHQWVSKDGRPNIDLFVGLFEEDRISWFPSSRGSLRRSDMYPTSTAPLHGHLCPLPHSPLVYLDKVYGPTWRQPDPAFRHTWDRQPYSDIAGRLGA